MMPLFRSWTLEAELHVLNSNSKVFCFISSNFPTSILWVLPLSHTIDIQIEKNPHKNNINPILTPITRRGRNPTFPFMIILQSLCLLCPATSSNAWNFGSDAISLKCKSTQNPRQINQQQRKNSKVLFTENIRWNHENLMTYAVEGKSVKILSPILSPNKRARR